jgi:hypothetical protein
VNQWPNGDPQFREGFVIVLSVPLSRTQQLCNSKRDEDTLFL